MSTSLITPTSSSAAAASGSTGNSAVTALGSATPSESTFLTLLVAQLKNQDPLSPTDSTQFVSELAQFSSLEQEIGINTNTANISSVIDPSAATGSTSGSSNTSGTSL